MAVDRLLRLCSEWTLEMDLSDKNNGATIEFLQSEWKWLKSMLIEGEVELGNVTQPKLSISYFLIPIYPYNIFTIPIKVRHSFCSLLY